MFGIKLSRGQKKRFYSILGGSALFVAAIVFHLCSLPLFSALCFIAAGVVAGAMCVTRAVRGILAGDFFDENTLMTIAAIGALLLSEFAECAAVMILYQVGELFQSVAVGKSRRAISELSRLCPDYANLVCDDSETKVSPHSLNVGDLIRIKPGERIPADCRIEAGETDVDTSPVTGESLPQACKAGDALYSGCINQSGVVLCKVIAKTKDSAAARILSLAESAGERKTRSEAFITRFARVYTPIVCILAICTALIVPAILWLLGIQKFDAALLEWSRRALTMLVISCPCALVISVPLGYFCGLGNASKNGILIKGSTFIDTLSEVDIAVFDKTGTLTEGLLTVNEVWSPLGREELLSLAAAAEEHSSHPIAKAITSVSEKKYNASKAREVRGEGVFATLTDGREIKVIKPPEGTEETCVFVYLDNEYAGRITFEDKIKSSAKPACASLKALGIKKCIMLTGDTAAIGERVGRTVGLDKVYSRLLPEEKYEKIEELTKEAKVMYVGDGINDTPSLARADVGIAMGAMGSPAAIESADTVLMSTDLKKLPYALKLAKRTVATVKANIAISLGVKIAVLCLAALNLVGMWAAICADVGVCILCVTNSTRLLK